jgi:hypothetical protein
LLSLFLRPERGMSQKIIGIIRNNNNSISIFSVTKLNKF